jgi:hypothetical protein
MRVHVAALLLLGACGDPGPQLTPHDYRLWISGEPDGFNLTEQYFSFKLEHDESVSGWGCLDYQCFPDPRAGECTATTLTEDEHVDLTDALNRADALEREDRFGCIDSPSFSFRLEVLRVGGAGNDFELQRCSLDDAAIDDVLRLAAGVVGTCRAL